MENIGATQHIDTGVLDSDKIDYSIECMQIGNNNGMFGTAYGGFTDHHTIYLYTTNTYFDYGTQEYPIPTTSTERHLYEQIGTEVYLDKNLKLEFRFQEWSSNNSLFLFKVSNTSLTTQCRIYMCKMYNSSILTRDFIPCYTTNSSWVNELGNSVPINTKGMYDLVTKTLYTNRGTGTDFIAGPDVN